MNIRKTLEVKQARDVKDAIMNYVGADPERMDELMECLFSDDEILCQKASWPIGFIVNKSPDLFYPYLSKMLKNLERPNHDAVLRNTMRIWSFLDIPEDLAGEIYEKSYEYLAEPKYPVGIRVFAMTVCGNICKRYPELAPELIDLIDTYLPLGTPGFISRAKHLKKKLSRLI